MDAAGGARSCTAAVRRAETECGRPVLTLVNLEAGHPRFNCGFFRRRCQADRQHRPNLNLPGRGPRVLADPRIFGVTSSAQIVQGYVRITSTTTRIAGYVRFGDPRTPSFRRACPS